MKVKQRYLSYQKIISDHKVDNDQIYQLSESYQSSVSEAVKTQLPEIINGCVGVGNYRKCINVLEERIADPHFKMITHDASSQVQDRMTMR